MCWTYEDKREWDEKSIKKYEKCEAKSSSFSTNDNEQHPNHLLFRHFFTDIQRHERKFTAMNIPAVLRAKNFPHFVIANKHVI